MRLSGLSFVPFILTGMLALSEETARADCNCVAIAGDVAAAIQAEVAKADGLYARGDFDGAFAIYAKLSASAKDPALLYAQGMAKWQLGAAAEAKGYFDAYLKAGGTLLYRDRVEGALAKISAGVTTPVAEVGGRVGGAVGGVGGVVGGVGGTAVGGVGAGLDAGAGVVGGVSMKAERPKPGKKVATVLGVVAVAAIGIVAIHSLRAGISDEVDFDFDPKFHLGLGISGVVVGISAIYVAGITGAAAAACAPGVATLPAHKPIVAPYAMNGGGGLAAAMTF
jgi:hypothetical protein